ncbi:MAG: NAD(P)H-hydrate dehydratase, partial [Aquihabitans sp.]
NVAEARALHKGRDAQREPEAVTRALAEELGCVVAVRGSTTWIAVPGEPLLVERGGVPGLATSGSGDVLAGLVAGLLARGARPLDAAAWAIHVHAAAGAHLAGPASGTGLLARELLDCIQPMLVARSEAPNGR